MSTSPSEWWKTNDLYVKANALRDFIDHSVTTGQLILPGFLDMCVEYLRNTHARTQQSSESHSGQ